jgi:hypothetical protein
MADSWFHKNLRAKIEDEIQTRAASIVSGICTDHTQYRYHCGVIEGLRMGLEMARVLEQDNN